MKYGEDRAPLSQRPIGGQVQNLNLGQQEQPADTPCWVKLREGASAGHRPGLAPRTLITGWIRSVTYVAVHNLWALVPGHRSAWQAARVEVNSSAMGDARSGAHSRAG